MDKEKDSENNLYSQDYILDKKVIIKQPINGYRVAIDPILLAASIDAKDGENILDIGSGVGAAAICLAKRLPNTKVVGVELQQEYVRLAYDNVVNNNLRGRVEFLKGDLLSPPPRLIAGSYSHVMANPPFLEATSSNLSPNDQKANSNQFFNVTFEHWAKFALLMVKPKGTVTFIHRADFLDRILSFFHNKLGGIVVYPIWSSKGKPAKRVIVRGTKNSFASMRLDSGMVLHYSDGSYTEEAQKILRDNCAIHF